MKNEITINGVKYIREDLVKKSDKSKTGYERAEEGCKFFYSNCMDEIGWDIDRDTNGALDCYDAANYYTNETIAENNARADTLMRRLRQWQALNDEPVDWNDVSADKWSIIDGNTTKPNLICIPTRGLRHMSVIYFSTAEKAREAIDVFRDELMWYFTEYRHRLEG